MVNSEQTIYLPKRVNKTVVLSQHTAGPHSNPMSLREDSCSAKTKEVFLHLVFTVCFGFDQDKFFFDDIYFSLFLDSTSTLMQC